MSRAAASARRWMVLDTGREGRNRINLVFVCFERAGNWIGATASITPVTAATALRFILLEPFELNVSAAAG